MLQLTPPDKTSTILSHVTFKPVIAVAVIEKAQIFRRSLVQTILKGDVTEERFILSSYILAGRKLATNDYPRLLQKRLANLNE